jgi:hypothetical protein
MSENNDTAKKLWEWNIHEDDLLANRANFILVAESMFLTAFAALAINSKTILPVILGISGLLLDIIWVLMTHIQVNNTTLFLREAMREEVKNSPFLAKYFEIADRRYKIKPNITDFIKIWIPALLLFTWVFLLVFYGLYAIGTIPLQTPFN